MNSMVKNNTKVVEMSDLFDLLQAVRNLLILQLSHDDVPILDIVKAAKMRSNDIYKIIPKKTKRKASSTRVR